MGKCANGEMCEWGNVQMCKWENVQMCKWSPLYVQFLKH